ncbi:hypothetical protein VNO78_11773 [Psophocarpus tetragonolobus]|uniref:Uncharacterized protein n=1 Tax=Psophocarpus tetragonolobus TaxID=3891 RepID=A0AAN9SN27_PSOTE
MYTCSRYKQCRKLKKETSLHLKPKARETVNEILVAVARKAQSLVAAFPKDGILFIHRRISYANDLSDLLHEKQLMDALMRDAEKNWTRRTR